MKPHKGKRLFITGIPTSGKSYLAERLATEVEGTVFSVDDFRDELAKDPRYEKWINFYLNQDEEAYYTKTSPDDQWKNLVNQSEHIWPAILEKIASYADDTHPVIFESVNILPHLASRDLNFSGIVLIGSSYEDTLERIQKEPRWGGSSRLQELEAKDFFYIERPRYKAEADKYSIPTYERADDAFEGVLELLKSD